MKKYFRIISKLIEDYGDDKRVIKHIIKMNNYMISSLTQSGGTPEESSRIIAAAKEVMISMIDKILREGENVQEVKELLTTMNAELSKLI
uniref:Uncharacterized protein n=1 Tax=viral metagenome TaxID=1070528 RepID=A0A6C0E058_9ZZZZ